MKKIKEFLENNNLTISFIESITGGALAYNLVLIPGASKVINEAHLAYSVSAKKNFGVTQEMIDQYSVVSCQVASQMARGLFDATKADVIVATTGNAGPTLQLNTTKLEAYIAVLYQGIIKCYYHSYDSKMTRIQIIKETTNHAIMDISKSLEI